MKTQRGRCKPLVTVSLVLEEGEGQTAQTCQEEASSSARPSQSFSSNSSFPSGSPTHTVGDQTHSVCFHHLWRSAKPKHGGQS